MRSGIVYPLAPLALPHKRDRIWIIAYPAGRDTNRDNDRALAEVRQGANAKSGGVRVPVANTDGQPGRERQAGEAVECARGRQSDRSGIRPYDLANTGCDGDRQGSGQVCSETGQAAQGTGRRLRAEPLDGGQHLANTDGAGLEVILAGEARQFAAALGASAWSAEPDVGRVAHGVPARVDRLRCLGNAIVPQIAALIGHALMERAA